MQLKIDHHKSSIANIINIDNINNINNINNTDNKSKIWFLNENINEINLNIEKK